jgi:hypothetical protein
MGLINQTAIFGAGRLRRKLTPRRPGTRRRLRVALLLLVAVSFLFPAAGPRTARADSPQAGEYQVKAAFILNFAGFIDWPDTAHGNGAFIIAILGRDPFEGAIDSLNGKTVKGRKVVIKRYDDPEEARDADILFISASEKRALPRIMKTLRNRSVLTVGDSQGFARSGVMISMVMQRKRVGFEINNRAAQQAGIRISSQLLKLAKEVIEP